MKLSYLNTLAILFFILVNTEYYWGNNLGMLSILWSMLIPVVIIILLCFLFYYIGRSWMERTVSKERAATIIVLLTVIICCSMKPYGMIDYSKYEAEPMLKAKAMGGGNCNSILNLYNDGAFIDDERCFGRTRTKGRWYYSGDTLHFTDIRLGNSKDAYYKFALINELSSGGGTYLRRFYGTEETKGHHMKILSNKLDDMISETSHE